MSVNVYKDDTSSSVTDRILRHSKTSSASMTGSKSSSYSLSEDKERKKHLSAFIEAKVNSYIHSLKEELDKEVKLIKKQQFQLH